MSLVSAVCVGGPYAGRVVRIDPALCVPFLVIHKFRDPSKRVKHEHLVPVQDMDPITVSRYRWEEIGIQCDTFQLVAVAMVHESMTPEDARLCVLAGALANLIERGIRSEEVKS